MTTRLFLIFNHQITSIQEEDARASLGIQKIKTMPPDLKDLWSNVPPHLPAIHNYLKPIQNWLSVNAEQNDYVLIQGDFGATFIMVNYAFKKGFIPVYSTTGREVIENHQPDGSVKLTHNFKHKVFRLYEMSSDLKTIA